MKALRIDAVGRFSYADIARPRPRRGEVLLQVRRVGYCGSDLGTFRGLNPLVSYPRIPGHEVAAVIAGTTEGVPPEFGTGTAVTVLPYTACGKCPSCRAGRANACQHNETLGVQRDGALAEFITAPWEKVLAAPLSLGELALVEPLSVGFHAVSRARVTAQDTVLVLGCGMIGLGAIAAAGLHRGARVIAVDVEAGKLALAMMKSVNRPRGISSLKNDCPLRSDQLYTTNPKALSASRMAGSSKASRSNFFNPLTRIPRLRKPSGSKAQ